MDGQSVRSFGWERSIMTQKTLMVLDRNHLDQMTGGDRALAAEVLGLFQEQVGLWSRLLDPKQPQDVWVDAAHTLKGTALGVGAFQLAKACQAAETLGREEKDVSATRAAVFIDDIRSAVIVAEQAVSELIYELSASEGFLASKEPNS